jgi:hypothetical protein
VVLALLILESEALTGSVAAVILSAESFDVVSVIFVVSVVVVVVVLGSVLSVLVLVLVLFVVDSVTVSGPIPFAPCL